MISGDDIEAFKEWNDDNDWWKDDASETFEDWFLTLKGMSVDIGTILVMFDEIIGVMRREYGE